VSEDMDIQVAGLITCFSVYVLMLFIFARAYHSLHLKRETKHFIFHKEILLGRTEEIEKLISNLDPEIEVLKYIAGEFEQGNDIEHITAEKRPVRLQSGKEYRIRERNVPGVDYMGVVRDYIITDVFILNDLGKERLKMQFEDAGYNSFKEALAYRETELTDLKQQLATIGAIVPNIWSYWDFFYFSVSTQTTLGSGDILPNSTPTRRLVTLQVFWGLAILVLAVNLVISILR
jgi:hypothetical protein